MGPPWDSMTFFCIGDLVLFAKKPQSVCSKRKVVACGTLSNFPSPMPG